MTLPPIGPALIRPDAEAKTTGAAVYPMDHQIPGLVHAVLVQSTVPAGRIVLIDAAAAEAADGVLAVITSHAKLGAPPHTAPVIQEPPISLRLCDQDFPCPRTLDDKVTFDGQTVALVVAETVEQATYAATLVTVDYEVDEDPILTMDDPRAELFRPEDYPIPSYARGSVDKGREAAVHTVTVDTTTPEQTNNPLGLFGTTVIWDGDDHMTVHDTTQFTAGVRQTLAEELGIPQANIRVLAPFVGGAFGAGLRTWSHVTFAALAAKQVGRPLRLELTRAQMFTAVGHRPPGRHQLSVGADADGRLTFIDHEVDEPNAMDDTFVEDPAGQTRLNYACDNVHTEYRTHRTNTPVATWMRAPGDAPNVHVLETAVDSLAYSCGLDPLEFRRRNFAVSDVEAGLPWSSNGLRDCYDIGARMIGWDLRNPVPGDTRDGGLLVGMGVAAASHGHMSGPADARVVVAPDGRVTVFTAATDIGTGTTAGLAQVAAVTLGVPFDKVTVVLGDSDLPHAPSEGGSLLLISCGSAVQQACRELLDGAASLDAVPGYGENELRTESSWTPASADKVSPRAFTAKFAEVTVDPLLGEVRVRRIVSVLDAGHIVNEAAARSQAIGGAVWGVGAALCEATGRDPRRGRVVGPDLGTYHIATCADVPRVDVEFVPVQDNTYEGIPIKGLGELTYLGVSAAIANAVFHATGKRTYDLPLTPGRVLG